MKTTVQAGKKAMLLPLRLMSSAGLLRGSATRGVHIASAQRNVLRFLARSGSAGLAWPNLPSC
jgi:hypothetical protein